MVDCTRSPRADGQSQLDPGPSLADQRWIENDAVLPLCAFAALKEGQSRYLCTADRQARARVALEYTVGQLQVDCLVSEVLKWKVSKGLCFFHRSKGSEFARNERWNTCGGMIRCDTLAMSR